MTQIPGGRLEVPRDPTESDDFVEAPRPARVSLLAIFSLVVGVVTLLGCCVPFIGPVGGLAAVGLGIAGFVMIRRSEGRLRGWGLAGAGVVTGLIAASVGSFMLIMLAQVTYAAAAYERVVEIAQREDQSELISVLTAESANAVTREELVAFREQSLARMGAVKGVRGGVMTWLEAIAQTNRVGPDVQAKYIRFGTGSIVAIPLEFEKGNGALVIAFDQTQTDPKLFFGRVVNAAIAPYDGSPLIWLIDPDRDLSLPAPAVPDMPATPDTTPLTPPATPPVTPPVTPTSPGTPESPQSPPGG